MNKFFIIFTIIFLLISCGPSEKEKKREAWKAQEKAKQLNRPNELHDCRMYAYDRCRSQINDFSLAPFEWCYADIVTKCMYEKGYNDTTMRERDSGVRLK